MNAFEAKLSLSEFVRIHRSVIVNRKRIKELKPWFTGEYAVILDAGKEQGKDHTRVEMIVNAEHKQMFIAHHSDGDAYACIDCCIEKLERQLTDHKEKIRNRKHPQSAPRKPGM